MSGEHRRQLRHTNTNGLNYGQTDQSSVDRFVPLKRKRRRKKVLKYGSKGWTEQNQKKNAEVFDTRGAHTITGLDLCDCLDTRCSGCFFKCPNKKCKSYKCGPDCRQKRKYYYESREDQIGDHKVVNDLVIKCDPNRNTIHIN